MHAAIRGTARKASLRSLHNFCWPRKSGRRSQVEEILSRPLLLSSRPCCRLAFQSASLSSSLHIERHDSPAKAARKESSVDKATFEEWLAANPLPPAANDQVQSPQRKTEEAILSTPSQDLNPQSDTGALDELAGKREGEWNQLGADWFESALSVQEGRSAQVVPALPVQIPVIDWSKIGNGAPTVRSRFLDSLEQKTKSSGSDGRWRSFTWKETRETLQRLLDQGRQLHWCPESRSFVEVDPHTKAPVFAFVPPSMQGWQLRQGAMIGAGHFLDYLQHGQVSAQGTDPSAQQTLHRRPPESGMQPPEGEESIEVSVLQESQSCPELPVFDLPPVQSISESCSEKMSSSDLRDQGLEDPSYSSSLAAQTRARPKQLRRLKSTSPLCRKEKHLVILLTSAAAALCIWEDGRLARHKVITAYTVRAKQGKSQLNHMRGRTGGGLSVGGSLRMQETARLFIRINEKLTEWADDLKGCGALFHSGPIRAWNEVFSWRDVPCPIDRKDPRWLRVGLSTQKPRLKELQRICYILSHGAMGPID